MAFEMLRIVYRNLRDTCTDNEIQFYKLKITIGIN